VHMQVVGGGGWGGMLADVAACIRACLHDTIRETLCLCIKAATRWGESERWNSVHSGVERRDWSLVGAPCVAGWGV
jgi:hypothetical protein